MAAKNAAQRIMDLFSGFEGQHGTHGTPYLEPGNDLKWQIKKVARTKREPITLELWSKHLEGKYPLGVVPIRKDSTCVWGSIDIDQYDIDLLEVIRKIDALKLPLVPCRSKSGGLHLFLFLKDPLPAELVQGALRDIAASLGFAGSEIFPKQTKILVEQGDQGNWIIMPYFGSDYGGKLKFQYGLKKTGAEMTLEEFLTIAEKRRVTEEQLTALRSTNKSQPDAAGKGKAKTGKVKPPFHNGPPCLQHMAVSGFPEGGRNNALFHIGVFLKKAEPADWQKALERDNQLYMRPPLTSDEVTSVIKSLEKKDYEYKCKDQPMVSHCDSVACRGRKFGVGAGGAYPVIEAISKLDTQPPLWFVEIPGARISMTTEELTNYRRFHTLCVARSNVVFKLIPDPVWIGILSEAMANVDMIEAGPDVGTAAVFREMLESFLTNRTRGESKEDLLRGAPWEDEEAGRHYFKLGPFEKFLQREGVRDMRRNEITTRITEDMKGGRFKMDIKGHRNLNFWWVPSSAIERAPELNAPKMREDEI